jgi:hypothetical protein
MVGEVIALVLANVSYLLVGAGGFLVLGFVDRRPSTWARLPAAYLFGVAIVIVPSMYLALLGVGVGWTSISILAVVLLVAGTLRARRSSVTDGAPPAAAGRSAWIGRVLTAALFGVALLVLLVAARAFVVTPLFVWDGWAMWAVKARVLYELPDGAAAILRGSNYPHASYPLGMPELEALGFRAMGRYDGSVIDLQLLALAVGLLGTLWSLSRGRAKGAVVAVVGLAVVTAPQFLSQLGTNYADVPGAIFVASALLAAARWLGADEPDPWALGCFVAFAGMAGLMKNEGSLFAGSAVVALLICACLTPGRRARDPVAAAAGVLAIILPWRVYTASYGVPTEDYDLGHLFNPAYLADHADRLWPIVTDLVSELTDTGRWGLLVPAVALALVAGLLSGRGSGGLFAALWVVLAFAGLVTTYWVSVLPLDNDLFNSGYRTVVSLVVGSACLVPILVDESVDRALDRGGAAARRLMRSAAPGSKPPRP